MDGFDLNIQNYTIKELKGLLSLGDVYDTYDVGIKKENICKKVSTDDTITIDMKIKMNNFIESVSKILLNVLESSSNYSLVKGGNASDAINDNTSFTDLKNIMQNGSNNMIIQDPFSAHIRKIDNNDNPGSNFDQYGTMRGVINPLLKNTILRGLNIDSRYRDDYYTTQSTDLNITLPYRIENVISYRLVSISIPITYYNISQHYGNNVIRIETYAPVGGLYSLLNTFDLILQDGIYNTTQNLNTFSTPIETEINNILNSNPNSPNVAIPLLPGPPGYTSPKLLYTINRVNGKSIFAQDVSATQPYYFKIITNVGLNISTGQVNKDYDVNKGIITRLGWTLGFRTAEHYSSNFNPAVVPPPSIYGSIVSSSICFTKYPIYGFLSIDDFNSNVNDYYTAVFADSISVPNIISKIDLTRLVDASGAFQAAQGESTSNSVNRERRFFGPVNIQKLRITLYDDLGYILDLNGMDWALELAFECVYSM